jgi:hypothetical protein
MFKKNSSALELPEEFTLQEWFEFLHKFLPSFGDAN